MQDLGLSYLNRSATGSPVATTCHTIPLEQNLSEVQKKKQGVVSFWIRVLALSGRLFWTFVGTIVKPLKNVDS